MAEDRDYDRKAPDLYGQTVDRQKGVQHHDGGLTVGAGARDGAPEDAPDAAGAPSRAPLDAHGAVLARLRVGRARRAATPTSGSSTPTS